MFGDIDAILNIEQFCELLDVGKSTGYNLLREGTVKAFKIGKVWKIPVEAVEEYVLKNIEDEGAA